MERRSRNRRSARRDPGEVRRAAQDGLIPGLQDVQESQGAYRPAGVPITNHGITIAYTLAIFERALEPFPSALETYRELTRAGMHRRRPGSIGTRRAAGRRPAGAKRG
jgi:hypothetical protein